MKTQYRTKLMDINCNYLGIKAMQLMENAGCAVARHCTNFNKIAVFCGAGNNGGDGLVAARHLHAQGKHVRIYMIGQPKSGIALHNFNIIKNLDINIEFIKDSSVCEKIKREIQSEGFDAVIDAVIGVGISGKLRQPIKSAVDVINGSGCFKIAVDEPSGGAVLADIVISFHKLCESEKNNPRIIEENIGIPEEAGCLSGPGDVELAVPKRSGYEHKGEFGRVLVIGGNEKYAGAPTLTARSALVAGADLSYVACPKTTAGRIIDPDLIIVPLDSENYIGADDICKIFDIDFDVAVIGNGIGVEDETREAVNSIIKKMCELKKGVVIDADALKLIDRDTTCEMPPDCILTPHLGELRKMVANSGRFSDISGSISGDKISAAEKFASLSNCTVILKGKEDIITNGTLTKINRTGNSRMSVGGTGDVLAGIAGSIMAQNIKSKNYLDIMSREEMNLYSASASAFICGAAGDIAAAEMGDHFTAGDVISKIPGAFKFSYNFIE